MNVPKIIVGIAHQRWSNNFMAEQNKTTQLVRNFLKKSRSLNPFNTNRSIDNILKRYEKSSW